MEEFQGVAGAAGAVVGGLGTSPRSCLRSTRFSLGSTARPVQ